MDWELVTILFLTFLFATSMYMTEKTRKREYEEAGRSIRGYSVLIAVTTGKTDGVKRLVLGLEKDNIKRLLNDQPILKDLGEAGVEGMEGWEIAILGPEDTIRFVAHFGVKDGR